MNLNPEKEQGMDYKNSKFQRLMHSAIVVENEYNISDLADFLGKKIDTVYAYCEGEVRLHLDIARRIIQYAGLKRPDDPRFCDHFCTPAGRISVPIAKAVVTPQDIERDFLHLPVLVGNIFDEWQKSVPDGISQEERKRLLKRIERTEAKLAEAKEKIKTGIL